jgi:histidine ammonia-lyase
MSAWVLAIELICSAQALDMRGCEGLMGKGTAAAYKVLRSVVERLTEDRVMYTDLRKASALVADGTIVDVVESIVGEL